MPGLTKRELQEVLRRTGVKTVKTVKKLPTKKIRKKPEPTGIPRGTGRFSIIRDGKPVSR